MILVTGGTGLLGSHLLYALLHEQGKGAQNQEKVVALKRPSSDLEEVKRVFGTIPMRRMNYSVASIGSMSI
jgi:dihydroflavonol-4-reductase